MAGLIAGIAEAGHIIRTTGRDVDPTIDPSDGKPPNGDLEDPRDKIGAGQPLLASAVLDMALTNRKPQPDAFHHSDQGVQYASKAYQQHLQTAGLIASMSRKGTRYDNAMMESFFSSLKLELMHHQRFADRAEERSKVFEYIDVF